MFEEAMPRQWSIANSRLIESRTVHLRRLAQSVADLARRMGIPGEPRLYTVLHVSY